jgi:hypothetical protein
LRSDGILQFAARWCPQRAHPGGRHEDSVFARGARRIAERLCSGSAAAAGTRGGGAEQLKSAAQQAVGSGKSSFPVKLTGVYTPDPSGAYFAADSVTVVPPG